MRFPIIFFLLCTSILFCGTSLSLAQERPYFEFRISTEEKFVGSQVLPSLVNSTSSPFFFQFKRRAYGTLASTVAASWYGVEKNNLRQSTLEGASILAAEELRDSTCAVLFERHDSLFVGEILPSLAIVRSVPLLVSSTANASLLASAMSGEGVRMCSFGAGSTLAITIGKYLFWCDFSLADSISIRLIDEYDIKDFVSLNGFTRSPNEPVCALLRESGVRKDVIMLSLKGEALWTESLDVQRSTVLKRVSNYTVAACVEQGSTTMVYIIRPKQSILSTGINTIPALICFLEEQTRISIFAVAQNNNSGKYYWEAIRMPFGGATSSEILWTFPDNILVPLTLTSAGNEYWCVFMNAVYVMNGSAEPLATGRIGTRFSMNDTDIQEFQARIREVRMTNQDADEARNNQLFTIELKNETLLISRTAVPLWWLRNFVRDSWLYGALLVVFGIIIALLYIVRYQRRLLVTLFGVPGADAMLILDEEGKLQSLNESARKLLNVAQEAPLNRLFQFYCVDAGALSLSTFAREALKLRTQVTKPITFNQVTENSDKEQASIDTLLNAEPHDYLFTAIPIQTRFGAMRGLMLTGKDITEELGKKKLGNWAQLAHDLQTNLAAIRLNAEKVAASNMNAEGQKILYQVNLIIKRVRDIITIGKSEDLETRVTDAAEICANVRKEFDEALFSNVGFEVYAQHILFECDQLKLERALRNAVENGIRAMPDAEGVISIRAWFETGTVCFQVQDTGEGMSADVQKNMMRKGFTTFGNKGGSGMGTMIMKYIVQMHGGEMLIQSEKGKGTAVQFRIPSRTAKHLQHLKPLEISGSDHISE